MNQTKHTCSLATRLYCTFMYHIHPEFFFTMVNHTYLNNSFPVFLFCSFIVSESSLSTLQFNLHLGKYINHQTLVNCKKKERGKKTILCTLLQRTHRESNLKVLATKKDSVYTHCLCKFYCLFKDSVRKSYRENKSESWKPCWQPLLCWTIQWIYNMMNCFSSLTWSGAKM